jgi:hypothetical protein
VCVKFCIFVIMELASRKVIHLHVTGNPTLEWTKQQVRNACFENNPSSCSRQRRKVRSVRSSVSSGEGREEGVMSIGIR